MKKYNQKVIAFTFALFTLASMILPSTLAMAHLDRVNPVISQLKAKSAVVTTNNDASVSFNLSEQSRVSVTIYKNNKRYKTGIYRVTMHKGLNNWTWKGTKQAGSYVIKVFALDRAGNYAISRSVNIKVVKDSIKSLAKVPNVNVAFGRTVKLPTVVKATYVSGKTAYAPVVWGSVDNRRTGVQTVLGKVAGTTLKARVNVVVGAETTAPTIKGTVYDQKNNTITITFSEKVKFTDDSSAGAAIITNQGLADKFMIRDNTTEQFVALIGTTTISLPIDGESLTGGVTKVVVQLATTPYAGEYSVAFKTTTIKDLAGNLFNDTYSNTRNFTVIDFPPKITSTVYDQTNNTITVTFSERVIFAKASDELSLELITTTQELADTVTIRKRTTGQLVAFTGTTLILPVPGESLTDGVTKVVVQLATAPAAGEYSIAFNTTILDIASNLFDNTNSNTREFTVAN